MNSVNNIFYRFQVVAIILAVFFVVGSLFFVNNLVFSANQSNITVQATVPAGGDCGNGQIDGAEGCDAGGANGVCPAVCSAACVANSCGGGGGGGGGGDTPPVISNVVVALPAFRAARITWIVQDDVGIGVGNFGYGVVEGVYQAYDIPAGAVGWDGSNSANLGDLLDNTKYYFRIKVSDSIGQEVVYFGFFTTFPAEGAGLVISDPSAQPLITQAFISWNTNIVANSQVLWGRTNQYGSTAVSGEMNTNHSLSLLPLIPNTIYHYKVISTDAQGHSASSGDLTFITNKDNIPPPDVTGLQLTVGINSISLSWVNPNLAVVPDFVGVKLLRKVGANGSQNINDGVLIYTGSAENFTDNTAQVNVEYTYTVFSYDTSGNYSGGVFKSGKLLPPPPPEVCDNNLDDDLDGKTDCVDPDCALHAKCQPPRRVEICGNTIDDDNNGKIDCEDEECKNNLQFCPIIPPVEICGNNLDDDGDLKIDCVDADCVAFPACKLPPGDLKPEVCDNGVDDDGDLKIDCLDTDCVGFPACAGKPIPVEPTEPEKPKPIPTVPVFAKLKVTDLLFLGGNRLISLTARDGEVLNLAGYNTTVGVPKKSLIGVFEKMIFVDSGGASHQFVFNPVADTYFADFIFPGTGVHPGYISVDYGHGQMDVVEFNLRGLSWGRVTGKGGISVGEIQITLLKGDGSVMEVANFGEKNPIITDDNGLYGWVVPNGQYFLLMQKEGYYERKVPIKVVNNIINVLLELTIKPPPLKIDPNISVAQNVQNVAQNLTEQVGTLGKVATEIVSDFTNNPDTQKTVSQVVAPTAVGVVAVGAVSLVSWSSLASFLQFLLFQPLMFFGRKKREQWGQVYNSLNKLPVDLAVVRLLDAKTGRLVQSRVTDTKGRYIFDAKPGQYRITASKEKFVFPSSFLKDFQTDGKRADIYHGELIKVDKNSMVLTVNIPLDPLGAGERPKRLLLQKILRTTQLFLSWTGLIITAGAFYISRKWYVGVLLVLNLFILLVARRLMTLKKPKGWGIVYDVISKKPITRVVARLFDAQFNKLVATQVTDNKGRYYFLAGENKYYVTYSHGNYEDKKTEIIDASTQKSDLIAPSIALQKTDKPKK